MKVIGVNIDMMHLQSLVRKFWKNQLFRFLIVGGINTLFGYLIYAFFIFIGLHYTLAALLGQICGILFNFNTTGRIVFYNTRKSLLFRFIGVYTFTYFVNIFFLRLFSLINFNMYVAGAILVLPIALLSYYLNKTYVFSAVQN